MDWLKKKADPVSDRARKLNSEIAALEQEIKKLNSQPGHGASPRWRSTALPHGAKAKAQPAPPPVAPEPIFEDVNQDRLKNKTEHITPPEKFNDLGVRKYDLAGLWQRMAARFRGPDTSNPRLVNYLAAGGVQGLRPMRFEKRVARNRLLALVGFLLLILLVVLSMVVRNH